MFPAIIFIPFVTVFLKKFTSELFFLVSYSGQMTPSNVDEVFSYDLFFILHY